MKIRVPFVALSTLFWVWVVTAQTEHRWLIPANDPAFPTSGTGYSASSPVHFTTTLVNEWMSDTGPEDVTIHFLPSSYPYLVFAPGNEPRLVIGAQGANKRIRLKGEVYRGFGNLVTGEEGTSGSEWSRPVLKMKNTVIYEDRWGIAGKEDRLLRSAQYAVTVQSGGDGVSRTSYIECFRMENLILDGDFPNLGVGTSAANATGYKLFALDVWARKGLLSNLLIKNFGVVGAVPGNAFNPAGTETFPVRFATFDDGQVPTRNADNSVTDGAAAPEAAWLVDRVDFTDFHATHGGYATLIMAQVYTLANNLRTDLSTLSPLAIVKNSFIQGNSRTIAFGCAGAKSANLETWSGPVRGGEFEDTDADKVYRAGRVLFEHNVVVNSDYVSNTDTGQIGPFELFNNVFLDCRRIAAFGQGNVNSYGDNLLLAGHRNLSISGNLIRFRGHQPYYNYDNYCQGSATDPNLALGRVEADYCAGLMVQGYARCVAMGNNRFTTWPAAKFDLNVGEVNPWTASTSFRPIYLLPSETALGCGLSPAMPREVPDDVTLWNNLISSTALDFTGSTLMSDSAARLNNLPGGPNRNNPWAAPGAPNPCELDQGAAMTWPRPAVANTHRNFNPAGRVERVIRRRFESGPANQVQKYALLGVIEVMLGEAYPQGGSLNVPVRAVEHLLPFQGSLEAVVGSPTGTRGLTGSAFLEYTVGNNAPETLAMALPGEGDRSGQVIFSVPMSALGQNASVRLRAWVDKAGTINAGPASDGMEAIAVPWGDSPAAPAAPGACNLSVVVGGTAIPAVPAEIRVHPDVDNGTTTDSNLQTNGMLDPDVDAWASSTYMHGTVVSLKASPDVGDDKNTAAQKQAKFVVRRNGTVGNLSVQVKVVPSGLTRPTAAGGSLDATYGTTGSADYYFSGGLASTDSWTGYAVGQTKTVVIPPGSESVAISVVTRADNLTEQNVVTLELVPGSSYAIDPGNQRAQVLIFDGPEFTLYELADSRWGSPNWSYANTVATGISSAASPHVSGWANHIVPPYSTPGGYWQTTWGSINDVWNVRNGGTSPLPYGIANSGMLVGIVPYGSPTRGFWRSGATQQHLGPTSGGNSGAYGVNPAATAAAHYIAGFSPVNTFKRPVVWVNGQTISPTDLLGTLNASPNAQNRLLGEARAANDAGVVVGEAQFANGGPSRPFRTRAASGSPIAVPALISGDELPNPGTFLDGRANAISAEGIAVGWFKLNSFPNPKVAAYWGTRNGTAPNDPGSILGLWQAATGGVFDKLSEALGIARVSGTDWIVGWSGDDETLSASNPKLKAVFMKGAGNSPVWRDLNDKHFTHGISGWSLRKATAVNAQGWIVGDGFLNGAPRGFLLVPRTTGQ